MTPDPRPLLTCSCSTADDRLDWPHEIDCALMTPAPLDVERLARALTEVQGGAFSSWLARTPFIAAAYDAICEEPTDE